MTVPARAERLRIALALCAGIPYLDPSEAARQGLTPLSPGDLGVLAESLTDDDLALLNASSRSSGNCGSGATRPSSGCRLASPGKSARLTSA